MRRQRSKTHAAESLPRQDAQKKALVSDPYALRRKLPDPSACTECRAIYRAGRWAWGAPPADAAEVVCPACKRIADDYPAGVVELRGEYVASHREELERLARNIEERERAEHPLKRIASIKTNGDVLEIATTDPKLARGIGTALRRAHRGTLHAPPTSRENLVRITWTR
jgi:NMD3 family